jgi:hypothetical protein
MSPIMPSQIADQRECLGCFVAIDFLDGKPRVYQHPVTHTRFGHERSADADAVAMKVGDGTPDPRIALHELGRDCKAHQLTLL